MAQIQKEHTVQDLLAFYDRVNPVLSQWLAKPTWTREETAMLCAGFVPHDSQKGGSAAAGDSANSFEGGTSMDPDGYLPPAHNLHGGYLRLLKGKGAASPHAMVDLLRPAIPLATLKAGGGWAQVRRACTLNSFKDLQWLLIIGSAVGLSVPALVPFGLLNGLRDRMVGQCAVEFPLMQEKDRCASTSVRIDAEKAGLPGMVDHAVEAESVAQTKPGAGQQKLRGRQPVQTTPEGRGYHTTEEVAGLTNLLPDTLNKYARKGIAVEGFTPFKRPNGRSWQWRDRQQQAEQDDAANAIVDQSRARVYVNGSGRQRPGAGSMPRMHPGA
ncbi:hypothetical protein RN01_30000 [Cupriavidus sp. SHE]|jgi:hypothetical protein|uniref:Uncharacterized protein n=1 Tax=Cupriavidus metallidurans TaxID=119219 RepID=A0A482ILN2_9BURK|nr:MULTISPECIES: hypothetical protein [Cupriavidus]KWR75171.1 hypothetical protein RN01_30000 [Cupriavidus sp. SHE]QBP10025.1 hypothetical protein DDF84_009755 [Cupriavidus metallidurans]